MHALRVSSFWGGGTLPALDRACLASFAQGGHAVTLYSFDAVPDLPAGVEAGDAAAIAPRETLGAFIYGGKPNLSHFSDYFRYRLFSLTDEAWIDTDLLLLRPINLPADASLFAKETASSICGAIMRIDRRDARLAALLARTEHLMHTELAWGATGPRLLNLVLGQRYVLNAAYAPETFFPVHYDDFCKPLLPEHKAECEKLCAAASTLHLWNNLVVNLGYWKELAPPEGSFLWSVLKMHGLLGLFRDTYPAEVMRHMVNNWRLRKSGGDIGMLKVAAQAVPSVVRTFGPRLRGLMQRVR